MFFAFLIEIVILHILICKIKLLNLVFIPTFLDIFFSNALNRNEQFRMKGFWMRTCLGLLIKQTTTLKPNNVHPGTWKLYCAKGYSSYVHMFFYVLNLGDYRHASFIFIKSAAPKGDQSFVYVCVCFSYTFWDPSSHLININQSYCKMHILLTLFLNK